MKIADFGISQRFDDNIGLNSISFLFYLFIFFTAFILIIKLEELAVLCLQKFSMDNSMENQLIFEVAELYFLCFVVMVDIPLLHIEKKAIKKLSKN